MILDAVVTEPKLNLYLDLPPDEYIGLAQSANENVLLHFREVFSNLPLDKDQCIATTGSDGKGERHSQSKTEFMVIQTEDRFPAINRDIRQTLSKSWHRDINPDIETKTIDSEVPLSWAFKDKRLIYPDRVLNAGFVIGNRQTYEEARERVLEEMTVGDRGGKRIRNYMDNQLHQYKKTIKTGISRGVEVFSLAEGWQYYSETAPIGFGFKHGFLRAVQRKFDILTARWARQGVVTIDRLAHDLPTATYEKFDYFTSVGLLEPRLADSSAEAYAWFLQQYHRVQEVYQLTREPALLAFSRGKFLEYGHPLTEFLNLIK